MDPHHKVAENGAVGTMGELSNVGENGDEG